MPRSGGGEGGRWAVATSKRRGTLEPPVLGRGWPRDLNHSPNFDLDLLGLTLSPCTLTSTSTSSTLARMRHTCTPAEPSLAQCSPSALLPCPLAHKPPSGLRLSETGYLGGSCLFEDGCAPFDAPCHPCRTLLLLLVRTFLPHAYAKSTEADMSCPHDLDVPHQHCSTAFADSDLQEHHNNTESSEMNVQSSTNKPSIIVNSRYLREPKPSAKRPFCKTRNFS